MLLGGRQRVRGVTRGQTEGMWCYLGADRGYVVLLGGRQRVRGVTRGQTEGTWCYYIRSRAE